MKKPIVYLEGDLITIRLNHGAATKLNYGNFFPLETIKEADIVAIASQGNT